MTRATKYLDSPEMREAIKRYIRAQMKLKNVRYQDLCDRLAEYGVIQDKLTLTNKITRGNYGAQLFVFILMALDIDQVKVSEFADLLDSMKDRP